jgi:acyl dehydratase
VRFLYFDDLAELEYVDLGQYVVTRERMLAFAREFDPQPFHLDDEAASKMLEGPIFASGWFTASVLMRLMVDGLLNRSAILPQRRMNEIFWPSPVRAGDTLFGRWTPTMVNLPTHPDRGSIEATGELRNQDGRLVLAVRATSFFGRKARSAT